MGNFEDQDQALTFFHLYCFNTKCQLSIYHHSLIVKAPFTAGNLLTSHICSSCKQSLVSAMDIEIRQMMAEVNSQTINSQKNNRIL
jgi:hypothetical protein